MPELRHIDAETLIHQPFFERIADDKLIVDHKYFELAPGIELEIDRSCRADFLAFPAARACCHVDYVIIRDIVRDRKVNGLSHGQAGVEIIGDFDRTYRGTLPAANASFLVYEQGGRSQRGSKISGFAFERRYFRAEQDLDILVEQALSQTELGRIIAVCRGKHFTHTAMVIWELVVQLREHSTQMRRLVRKENMIFHLSQVESRPDTADSGSDYQN